MSDSVQQFQGMITDAVRDRRAGGLKAAFREVARLYQLSDRRVRAAWHGEIRDVSASEWHEVRRIHIELMRLRQARLEHELAMLRALMIERDSL